MAPLTHTRKQFRLYAYVCNGACVQQADIDGTVTFMAIFMKRPAACRYAVVGNWDVNQHKEVIWVWDLFDTKQVKSGNIYPPEPVAVYEDVDQAIMATLMLYGDAA